MHYSICIFRTLGLVNLFVLVRDKALYHASPYRQGRTVFGEYCRKVGFGDDGAARGWLLELLGPVTDSVSIKSGASNGLEVGF